MTNQEKLHKLYRLGIISQEDYEKITTFLIAGATLEFHQSNPAGNECLYSVTAKIEIVKFGEQI